MKENILKIEKAFYVNTVKDKPKTFIKESLNWLKTELELYYKHFQDARLFEYNERAILGFYTNGLIRQKNDRFQAIQEYCVYDEKNKSKGRADLLIYDTKTNIYYLIEAKHSYQNEKSEKKYDTDEKILDYFEDPLIQVKDYYISEFNIFYKEKTNVYLMLLCFDSIKLTSELEYDKYIKDNKGYSSQIYNYFNIFFYSKAIKKPNGLGIYGIIRKPNESLKLYV